MPTTKVSTTALSNSATDATSQPMPSIISPQFSPPASQSRPGSSHFGEIMLPSTPQGSSHIRSRAWVGWPSSGSRHRTSRGNSPCSRSSSGRHHKACPRPPGQRRPGSGAATGQRPICRSRRALLTVSPAGGFDAAREAEEVFHVRTVVTICCSTAIMSFGGNTFIFWRAGFEPRSDARWGLIYQYPL